MGTEPFDRLRMGKSGITAAIAACFLLALLVAYYLFSPLIFLRSLASAAKNGDRDTIAREVDFPAVRQGLGDQLDALLAARAEKHRLVRRSGFDRAVEAFLPSLGHQLINSIVTPDGVASLLRRHVKLASDGSGRPSLWEGQMAWLSPNHVLVTYANVHRPELSLSIELERQEMFGWRVFRLNLPLKELAGVRS
jgi:Protein of unknown function (DUF2939)